MGNQGIFISGIFVGFDKIDRVYDEKQQVQYVYLIAVGAAAYRITSQKDYSDRIQFGDEVLFSLRPRAYNNSLYYSGDLLEWLEKIGLQYSHAA